MPGVSAIPVSLMGVILGSLMHLRLKSIRLACMNHVTVENKPCLHWRLDFERVSQINLRIHRKFIYIVSILNQRKNCCFEARRQRMDFFSSGSIYLTRRLSMQYRSLAYYLGTTDALHNGITVVRTHEQCTSSGLKFGRVIQNEWSRVEN